MDSSTPFCVLLTTPRSGSHLLMSALAARGTVLLAEYTAPYLGQLRSEGRISDSVRARLLADIDRADASRAKSRIGELGSREFVARGTKLFPAEVELICTQWGSLERFFGRPDTRLIRLRRADIIAQAVSLFLAEQTGHWFAYVDSQPGAMELAYDGAALRRCLDLLREGEAILDHYLVDAGERLTVVEYEQLVREPERTLRALAADCGHALAADCPVELPILFHKQGSSINVAFAERFRRDLEVAGA